MEQPHIVTITSEVRDRTSRRVAWGVMAAYVANEHGDPVCVEYRVRQIRGASSAERLQNLHLTLDALEEGATTDLAGSGEFSAVGIPRYVFEEASQGRLIDKARRFIERGSPRVTGVTAEAKTLLQGRERKPGRPPQRSTLEKLRILLAVEEGIRAGQTLQDVADAFHMSRSAVRDLLTWARRDSDPRLFTARGQGRAGGELTPEARVLLTALEREGRADG